MTLKKLLIILGIGFFIAGVLYIASIRDEKLMAVNYCFDSFDNPYICE